MKLVAFLASRTPKQLRAYRTGKSISRKFKSCARTVAKASRLQNMIDKRVAAALEETAQNFY